MADKKDKGIKEDFTHFLLDDELSKTMDPIKEIPENKTEVARKTMATSSPQDHLVNIEASLKQSEYLRVAQKRISDLEKTIDSLRAENEQLSTAGIILQKKHENMNAKLENLEKQLKHAQEIHKEEKGLLEKIVSERNREKSQHDSKIEELQSRLQEKLNGVRLRERELENRLELLKIEGQVSLNNKDEMILDIKHKLDQLTFELDNYKNRGKDLNAQLNNHKEQIRRTVKALRLALTMLEGEGLSNVDIKKTGSES